MRRARLLLAGGALLLLGACGGGGAGGAGAAGSDGGAGDGPPAAAIPQFNVFAQASNVWPGSFADVKVFFQSPPSEAWRLTLGPVTGGAQVTLDADTLDEGAPATLVHVDVPATATGAVSFEVTATNAGRELKGTAEIGIYRAEAATAPGYAVTATAAASPDPAKARFKARVVGYGGFEGRVYLVLAGGEGTGQVTLADESLMVSGAAPAETTLDLQLPPGTVPQLSLFAAWHTHVEVANAMAGKPLPAGDGVVAIVPRTVVLSPSETQAIRYDLQPANGAPEAPVLELAAGAPAGFSLGPRGLEAGAGAPPGVTELPVTIRRGTVSAPAKLHVSVVPAARAGWSLVGPTVAGRDCGGAAVSAVAQEVATFAGAARCRYRDGAWVRAADDGSAVWTLTRGTVRYEARETPMSAITLNVVDFDPNGRGTLFWQVVDEKGGKRGAPTAAVDDSGQWWLAFADQNGRARAFRHGTVGAGVPASDGLPQTVTSGGRPYIAANGQTLYLAFAKADDGAMQVYRCNRAASPPTWSLMGGLTATVDPTNTSYALDVDPLQRPVLAWAAADGKVHVARNAGAWDDLGAFTPHQGGLPFDVSVVADRAGDPLIGWRAAAHVQVGGVYPAPTSHTAVELRRGAVVAKLEPTDPRSPITAFSMALDENDAPVVAEVEGPVTQVLRWVGP